MLRTALRNLSARKLRLLTTGLAVMLGVAFIAGTLVLKDTLQKTFDELFADVYEETDAVVRAKAAFEDPNGFGDQRGRIDESLLDVVARVDGVNAVQGDLFGFAQIVDKEGEPIGDPQHGAPVFGGNWPEVDQLNAWTLVSGRGPEADDEVVIDKKSADDAGYVVGDTATVLVKGGPQQFRVAGIVKFGEVSSPGGATFAIFTTEASHRLLGEPGKLDSVSVVADDGISQEEIVDRISRALPPGSNTEAVTGEAITKESQDALRQGMSIFNTVMLVFAFISLFVGGFIILNTFTITVAQRTKENALLRAIGATRRQVLATVMLEALAVGLIASAIGVVAGLAVAAGLKELIGAFGFDIPAGSVAFTGNTVLYSMVAGTLITLVFAQSPARKAGKVPPVAAMRDVAVGSTGYGSKERVFVGSGILVLGGVSLLFGLFGNPSNALALVGLGALSTLVGVTVLGRTIALPLSRVLGAPLPRLRGVAGHLARENAMRNPKRTAATAAALMIGVGLVSCITIFAASMKASFDAIIDRAFVGDVVVTSSTGFGSGGIDPALTEKVAALPEVDIAAGVRGGFASIDGSPQMLYGASLETFEVFHVGPVAGTPEDLDTDTIAVSEAEAEDRGLSLGDTVSVVFRDTGEKQLRIAMIYEDPPPEGDWMLGIAAYEENYADQFDLQVFVRLADGVDPAAAVAAVEREADAYPGTKVLDQTEYKAEQTGQIDQMLGLVYALLGLAIVIALLGIGNALALSILERTRELGVLRAVGMTRSQLRSAVRWEAVIIATQGTLLGIVVGVFFGWALSAALKDEGMEVFQLPVTSLAMVVILGALAGIVSAIMPARRAAKLNVLRAVVTE